MFQRFHRVLALAALLFGGALIAFLVMDVAPRPASGAPAMSPTIRHTVLNVSCTSAAAFGSAYTKITDIGDFTAASADSVVEVTYHGRVNVDTLAGTTGYCLRASCRRPAVTGGPGAGTHQHRRHQRRARLIYRDLPQPHCRRAHREHLGAHFHGQQWHWRARRSRLLELGRGHCARVHGVWLRLPANYDRGVSGKLKGARQRAAWPLRCFRNRPARGRRRGADGGRRRTRGRSPSGPGRWRWWRRACRGS
jgi:hypothetical protein